MTYLGQASNGLWALSKRPVRLDTIGDAVDAIMLNGLTVPLLLAELARTVPSFPVNEFRLESRAHVVPVNIRSLAQYGWDWYLKMIIITEGGQMLITEHWHRLPKDTTANRHLFNGQAGRQR